MYRITFIIWITLAAPCLVWAADDSTDSALAVEPVVVGSPTRIEVFPQKLELRGPRDRMHLIVTGHYADGSTQDLTRVAKFASGAPQTAAVESAVAVPVADGRTQITVRAGGKSARAEVSVIRHDRANPVSFHNETIAVLTKYGCNSGACHGSPSGKGGFSLSMMGFDTKADRRTLIRQGWNRRTNVIEPERSLLLRKPTMQVAHGGSLRFRENETGYRLLHQWIYEGCRPDADDAPKCVAIDVYPPSGRVYRFPAHTQQLCVLAKFSDGSVRDVTSICTFTSSNEMVADVTRSGLVVGNDRGEMAVSVRYLDKLVSRTFTFVREVEGFVWNKPKSNNYVDDLVHEQLKLLRYTPSELCSDTHFIRRVSLDVSGLLPTVDRSKKFLADADPKKRVRLIDELLERPEYAKYWAQKLSDLLRVNPKTLTDAGARKYYAWIADSVAANQPYDEFVRELLTASGDTYENPAANYYRAAGDTNTATETTTQLFMGVRIACAKCHNHPFERWTQDNYYGIAAVFHRVKRDGKNNSSMKISVLDQGEMRQPRTGDVMQPWLPLTGIAKVDSTEDRRGVFAEWLTAAENPFFARVAVNRVWAQLMGRGIVDPVDDFRSSNPPANAKLLDALAADFVKHGFDRKQILRVILNSRTYQRSIDRNAFNKLDDRHFSAQQARLLSAEQLLDVVCDVTGVPEKFKNVPEGTRATQLPVPLRSEFLTAFGQPKRETACQCERESEPTLIQALQLLNGPTLQNKINSDKNRVQRLIGAGKTDSEIVEELYLVAFARVPRDVERKRVIEYVSKKDDRAQAFNDVLWALLNTREFLFQH